MSNAASCAALSSIAVRTWTADTSNAVSRFSLEIDPARKEGF